MFFYIFSKGKAEFASIAGVIFIILFYIYGIFFELLRKADVFQIEHYLFIPFFALFAIYISWFLGMQITKKLPKVSWNVSMIMLSSLILFSLVKIIPDEIKKIDVSKATASTSTTTVQNLTANENSPDIYLLIFDEYVGFEGMRKYWKYNEIDTFVDFLKSKGFYIAEDSHEIPSTLYSLSTRLNYDENYQPDADNQVFYEALSKNNVMQYIKNYGYSTVTFDGLYYAWKGRPQIVSDYTYEPTENYSGGLFSTEFEKLVLQNTMVMPFLYNDKQDDPTAVRNRSMIFYTKNQIANLPDVPSPKFVYVHLMLPHSPFLFNANCEPLDPQYYMNYSYYFGNYVCATSIAHDIVNSILASADPKRPPVIILQSDHGARNGTDLYTNLLQNYPDEYRQLIMNALYLPGCDTSNLTQDMKPVNTFPVIF